MTLIPSSKRLGMEYRIPGRAESHVMSRLRFSRCSRSQKYELNCRTKSAKASQHLSCTRHEFRSFERRLWIANASMRPPNSTSWVAKIEPDEPDHDVVRWGHRSSLAMIRTGSSADTGCTSRCLVHLSMCLLVLSWLLLAGSLFAAESPTPTTVTEPEWTESDRDHWSFRPLLETSPPSVQDLHWPRTVVDRFILARLEAEQLQPQLPADKLTRLRRMTFDLTGLPPTLEAQHEFLNDSSPDADARVIDRLLASPAYGERWAQHWLDLARFAETDGFEHDLVRPNAWRFRDWVVKALNDDLPYDEFVRLQIAGDILRPGDPDAAIATGWLLCGPDMPDINLQEERRHVVLNEVTSTVGAVFLGLQIGCAQCHDHKFDPLSQADFYRLRACFESAQIFQDHPIPTPAELAELDRVKQQRGSLSQSLDQELTKWNEIARQRIRDKNPDLQPTSKDLLEALAEDERKVYRDLTRKRDLLPKLPELPKGRVLREGQAVECHFCIRGDFRRLGRPMPPDFPRVLSRGASDNLSQFEMSPESEADRQMQPPRLRLARWLTRPDNALAARVIVNRVWQFHFGEGLVRTPSDFGKMGDDTEHPELLDWLALEFPRHNWSLKWLHRQLMLSATYQQSSRPIMADLAPEEQQRVEQNWDALRQKDPTNRLWGRMNRLRLEGETIRDALLIQSDRLNYRATGPGVRPPLPPEMISTLLKNQWPVTPDVTEHQRRSLYLFVRRNLRYPLFDAFDRPDTNASCPRRNRSTIAPQALILLNSELSLTAARDACGWILKTAPSDQDQQIRFCYQRALSRLPTPDELATGLRFLESESQLLLDSNRANSDLPLPANIPPGVSLQHAAALTEYCLAIFNLNEFIYVD